jgi:hypothetical protein
MRNEARLGLFDSPGREVFKALVLQVGSLQPPALHAQYPDGLPVSPHFLGALE